MILRVIGALYKQPSEERRERYDDVKQDQFFGAFLAHYDQATSSSDYN